MPFFFSTAVDDVPVNSDELHAGWKLTLPAHIKRHAVQAMRLKQGTARNFRRQRLENPGSDGRS